MRRSTPKAAAGLTLAACAGDGGGSGSAAVQATSLPEFGPMEELVAAAQEEGEALVRPEGLLVAAAAPEA